MCTFLLLNIYDRRPNILLYPGKLSITIQSSNLITVERAHQVSGQPQNKVTIHIIWRVEAVLKKTECASPIILRTHVSGIKIKCHVSLILDRMLSLASGPASRPPSNHRNHHFPHSASLHWKSGAEIHVSIMKSFYQRCYKIIF